MLGKFALSSNLYRSQIGHLDAIPTLLQHSTNTTSQGLVQLSGSFACQF
jgi:hypothetical protein